MDNMHTSDKPLPGVLFVDDEKNILTSLRRLMMEEECSVFTADSGEEGLEVLRREKGIGVIVSDQRMPGMGGAQFLEQSRTIVPEALRIILTGYADIQATMDAINRGGAYRYITKPWSDDDLVQTIRDALRQYALVEENRRLNVIVAVQNEELREWNGRLKGRVLQQTGEIRRKNEELDLRNRQLVQTFQSTILAFSSLLELRSKKLRNHSRNVTEVTTRLAESLALPAAEKETLRIASLLHDIGEIGNPDHLMNENIYELEGKDLELFMKHAVRGQATIDAIEELRPAGLLIRHHHERFDGSGWPDGLKGEAIPLGARVIHLADFVDRQIALQQEPSIREALDKARELEGSWFDPTLFSQVEAAAKAAYTRLFARGGLARRNMTPGDLVTGMILAEDLLTGTGVMLLNKGSVLNRTNIAAIHRYHELDPILQLIPVLLSDEE